MYLFTAKRYVFVLLLVFFFSVPSIACDICGCGLGNYYIGLVPQFNRHFIGLRYQYQSFHTHLADNPTQFSNDYFQTTEIWGGINFGKRWQMLAFIPISVNHQSSDDGKTKKAGLSDAAVLLNYSLFEKSALTKSGEMITQQFWIGGGIKLPTGTTNIDPGAADIIALANSQLGSGSVDFMLNAEYSLHVNKWGFTTNASYKINTKSKEDYRFGNRFASNNFIFCTFQTKRISLTPNVGFQYEHTASSSLKEINVAQTNGYSTFGTIGLEAGIGKVNIGMNIQNPLAQDNAEGQTKAGTRIMAHLTFSL